MTNNIPKLLYEDQKKIKVVWFFVILFSKSMYLSFVISDLQVIVCYFLFYFIRLGTLNFYFNGRQLQTMCLVVVALLLLVCELSKQ